MSDVHETRRFHPAVDAAGQADAATAEWLKAISLGFLDAEPAHSHLDRLAAAYRDNGWTLTGAYAAGALAAADEMPIATYATFDRGLNVGGGADITARLVAGVTVRTSHRRRGLLRGIIEQDLREAAADGIPIAALYAAEAGIYGRFGFGPATETRRIQLDTGPGFRLDHARAGVVEVVDRAALARIAPEVFDRFHAQTVGSIQRQTFTAEKVAGLWGDDKAEPDPTVRGIVHYDATGAADGYVAYRFTGWEQRPATIELRDVIAFTPNAALELWQHLAAIDLVTRIEWDHAPVSDPLPWALADRRRYAVVGGEDGLWLRILDVVSALGARSYDSDGDITIEVDDALDITAGRFRLESHGGRGTAAPTTGKPDVSLAVSTLSSLYLGGPSALVLARAGLIDGSEADVTRLDRLLRHRTEPVCHTHF